MCHIMNLLLSIQHLEDTITGNTKKSILKIHLQSRGRLSIITLTYTNTVRPGIIPYLCKYHKTFV